MKGIILAGGSGTRLYPVTTVVSKQLLPVYDKPTIYYPLSVLMLADIRDILIISTPRDIPFIEGLLGDGSQFGIHISYQVQDKPNGIPEAFILGEKFIGDDDVCLILGDNVFYGDELPRILRAAASQMNGAYIFPYRVNNPKRYGVVEFDDQGQVISLEEKPEKPKSNWAITGLYMYDSRVAGMAKSLEPSNRGETEITDLNRLYHQNGELEVRLLGRGVAWLDTGTADALLSASSFVKTLEKRQGLKISCIEEIALRRKMIDKEQFLKLAARYRNSKYGKYLFNVAETSTKDAHIERLQKKQRRDLPDS